jgi:hypothetical protein
MNIFPFFRLCKKTDNRPAREAAYENRLPFPDSFCIFDNKTVAGDHYLLNAWVNIAVNILTRNIARAAFCVKKGGNDVTSGPLYELFRRPNFSLSRFDLWKETAAWWHIEGEAFWWFGPGYAGGLPRELYILNPRKLRHEENAAGLGKGPHHKTGRWFYYEGTERIPILRDELIHFKDWNPWNPARGVNPLVSTLTTTRRARRRKPRTRWKNC